MNRAAVLFSSGFAAVISAAIVLACSPDPGPFFTPPAVPENQSLFNRGKLGLLTPVLEKEDELLAFRILSGLTVAEPSADPEEPTPQATGIQAWEAARTALSLPSPAGFISAYRISHSAPSGVYYLNCLDEAFETAAHTLNDRRRTYPTPAATAAWVAAQDLVFQDCSSITPVYPETVTTGANPLVRADRDYQIAAAHFYSEDLPEAERRFRAIAADQKSPWQRFGNYMVGRTLLREASLQNNAAAATAARRQFASVAKDESADSLAVSAQGLLRHLDAIEHPGAVMTLLSKQLLLTHPPLDAFADTLAQSVYVLRADTFNKAMGGPDLPEAFDWVHTLENGGSDHALSKWTATHTLPWLMLSLMYAGGKDSAAVELIEEAAKLRPESPAFATAAYNAVRLRIERGDTSIARTQVDALISGAKNQPDSLANAWRAERMRVATSFADFLRWAPRKPINAADLAGNKSNEESPVLALDAAAILDYKTPLTKLDAAAHSASLPSWSTADIAIAAWTRAFVLNDLSVIRDVAPLVAKAHPNWTSSLIPDSPNGSDEWRFRAALLVAQHREFQPLVPVDYRNHFSAGSWWCAIPGALDQQNERNHPEVAWKLPALFTPPESVISRKDKTAAEKESKDLSAAGSAQQFLAPVFFNWADAHRQDPQVPQALHRLVVVVRYGCHAGSPADGRISKQAFDLLHERYPNSQWTKQTPYWFGPQ